MNTKEMIDRMASNYDSTHYSDFDKKEVSLENLKDTFYSYITEVYENPGFRHIGFCLTRGDDKVIEYVKLTALKKEATSSELKAFASKLSDLASKRRARNLRRGFEFKGNQK